MLTAWSNLLPNSAGIKLRMSALMVDDDALQVYSYSFDLKVVY